MLGSPATFARRLLRWYDRARRDLPWRAHLATNSEPDPYHVLVSEAMLQQTQVAAVVPYFKRFLERFPTLEALAGADEQEVLRLWQGLGYYSRARNLQAAARKVVSDFGGRVPAEVEQLLTLPGVGRYTAGAVASIAFGRRAAALLGSTHDNCQRCTVAKIFGGTPGVNSRQLPKMHCRKNFRIRRLRFIAARQLS